MNLARALALMRAAHAGKTDLGGKPYWTHPMRVMGHLGPDASEAARITALLHDVVEDSGVTLDDLRTEFSSAVVEAVGLLTRVPGEPYFTYIDRLARSGNALAIKVKLADLTDNLDPARAWSRKKSLTVRYEKARNILLAHLAP